MIKKFFNFKFIQRFNKQNTRFNNNKQNIRQNDRFDDYDEYNQSIY